MLNERQLTANRRDLIQTVTKNKDAHIKAYEQAVEDYADATKKCIRDLHAMIKKDPKGFDHNDAFTELEKPREYRSEYERVLSILELSVEDEVVISFDQHEKWVRDNWGWKHSFLSNSTTLAEYKIKGRRG